jgi:1-deoxy-D-xylulose-5-phosphate reductoisomerase
MKKIVVLGSTGSIGQNTLRVIDHLQGKFRVIALAARSRIDVLEAQARAYLPEIIAVFDKEKALELQKRLPGMRVVGGMEGLCEAAALQGADIVVSAMVGTVGILPSFVAMESGCRRIALANKEVLVSAGEIFMHRLAEKQIELLPIDSEHSALFQCLDGKPVNALRRLVLTASGGPFWKRKGNAPITVDEALAHPTWNMGPKITIDCSTLMNKGLEVIEAHFLFQVPLEKIEVVIHPQSVIHSMVEWTDGSMIAQMSAPNMIIPIQYSLTYPERCAGMLEPFDFQKFSTLEFHQPEKKKFICLELAFEALRVKGTAPCFLNAANEVLVTRFLNGQIAWSDIPAKLEKLLEGHRIEQALCVEKILEIDTLAREQASIA